MVRGVNRTVIEVNCTEHRVFERALLFVRPGTHRPEASLRREADEYVSLAGLGLEEKPAERKRAWKLLWAGAQLLLALAAGLLLGALLL